MFENNNMWLVPDKDLPSNVRWSVFSVLTPVPVLRKWLKQALLGIQPVVKSQRILFPGAQPHSQLLCFCMLLIIWDSATALIGSQNQIFFTVTYMQLYWHLYSCQTNKKWTRTLPQCEAQSICFFRLFFLTNLCSDTWRKPLIVLFA